MTEETTGSIETVGPPESSPRGSRRLAALAGVGAVIVALLGGGAYAAYNWLDGGGPQPDDVLPSSTVALVSVDLDPSAGQKIAAIKSIRKFPALRKKLGLEADDDLRRWLFEEVTKDSDCKGLDFEQDVSPWLGKRAAFGAVDLGGSDPSPVVALQITDREKAQKGFQAIVECSDPGDDFGYAVGDDYLVASDSTAHARSVLARGADQPLADDPAYQKWTEEAGDPGFVNFYVARKAVDHLSDALGDSPSADRGLTDALAGFQGLGGTIRFADGGVEATVAAGGLTMMQHRPAVGRDIADLPGDTALAFGLGVPEDLASTLVDQLGSLGGSEDLVTEAEGQTGLDLPEDLQTLLGRSLILSLGGQAPAAVDSPEDVPAGLVIRGDAEKIKAVIAKVEDHLGMHLSDVPLVVEGSGDKLAIATSSDYAAQLQKDGSLGSEDGFRSAVPEADRADGVLYVDFDSAWRDTIRKQIAEDDGAGAAKEFADNTAPLRSLGLSSWQDGGITHALLKVATD